MLNTHDEVTVRKENMPTNAQGWDILFQLPLPYDDRQSINKLA